jgi:hypothetical protein
LATLTSDLDDSEFERVNNSASQSSDEEYSNRSNLKAKQIKKVTVDVPLTNYPLVPSSSQTLNNPAFTFGLVSNNENSSFALEENEFVISSPVVHSFSQERSSVNNTSEGFGKNDNNLNLNVNQETSKVGEKCKCSV